MHLIRRNAETLFLISLKNEGVVKNSDTVNKSWNFWFCVRCQFVERRTLRVIYSMKPCNRWKFTVKIRFQTKHFRRAMRLKWRTRLSEDVIMKPSLMSMEFAIICAWFCLIFKLWLSEATQWLAFNWQHFERTNNLTNISLLTVMASLFEVSVARIERHSRNNSIVATNFDFSWPIHKKIRIAKSNYIHQAKEITKTKLEQYKSIDFGLESIRRTAECGGSWYFPEQFERRKSHCNIDRRP